MSRLIIAGLLSLASALAWGVVGPGGGGSGGGSGTVSSGNSGEYACYASSGTVVSGCAAPASTSGLSMGQIAYKSGANTIGGVTIGSGLDFTAGTLSATGGSFSASSTSTLTNKTYDTAGTGNSFSINGVAVTANTGTGGVVRATAPTVDLPKVTSYTWSGKPAAASYSGAMIRISDVGPVTSGSLWISNGTDWRPINGHTLLSTLDAVQSTAGAITETILYTYTIPAGLLRNKDSLRVQLWANKSGSTYRCTTRIKANSVANLTGSPTSWFNDGGTLDTTARQFGTIQGFRREDSTHIYRTGAATGSGATAPMLPWANVSASDPTLLTVTDMDSAVYVMVTMQSTNAAENCLLQGATIELVPSAN